MTQNNSAGGRPADNWFVSGGPSSGGGYGRIEMTLNTPLDVGEEIMVDFRMPEALNRGAADMHKLAFSFNAYHAGVVDLTTQHLADGAPIDHRVGYLGGDNVNSLYKDGSGSNVVGGASPLSEIRWIGDTDLGEVSSILSNGHNTTPGFNHDVDQIVTTITPGGIDPLPAGSRFTWTFDGWVGHSIPEPGTALLGGISCLLLLFRRARRGLLGGA